MQPYRIEEMARAIYDDTTTGSLGWDDLNDYDQSLFIDKARAYAAALLGGAPVVTVEHGVARRGRTASLRTYRVPQAVVGDEKQVRREKVVYPAAAFVTEWTAADGSTASEGSLYFAVGDRVRVTSARVSVAPGYGGATGTITKVDEHDHRRNPYVVTFDNPDLNPAHESRWSGEALELLPPVSA